jgi:hypothetical protein
MIRNLLIEQGMSLNLPEEAFNFIETIIATSRGKSYQNSASNDQR